VESNYIKNINQNEIISEKDAKEYVLQQFNNVKTSNRINNLVKFQANNKYMIMAHDQTELKKLGNIVASHKKIQFSSILKEYEEHLEIAMLKDATTKTHTNVIMHVIEHFSKHLNQNEKQRIFSLLEQFRVKNITIGKMLLEISPTIYRFNCTYLASQTYFLLYADVEQRILFYDFNKKDHIK